MLPLASCCAATLAVLLWLSAPSLPDGGVLRFGAAVAAFLAVLSAVASVRFRAATASVLPVDRIPQRRNEVYVGEGFEWRVSDAETVWAEGGSPWEAARMRGLFAPERLLEQHVLLLGTTGTGKTRMLELLILQAIARGEAVAIVDPKGDERLAQVVRTAAERAGRTFRYFSLPTPETSVRYNPVGHYAQVREVADRIAALLPAEGEAMSFRNYGWEVVDTVARALAVAEEPVTLIALKRFAIDQPWALVRTILERRFPKIPRPGEASRVAEVYETLVSKGKVEPCPALDALVALARRPHEHFLKMVSALVPILTRLAGCEALTPGWSWREAEEKREVVYFFLGSLLGYETANAVAKMALLDFQSFVGRRYVERRREPFSLFVDELGDVLTPEFVNIVNKCRGAGVRVTACAQTLSDFEAALGSRARALQVIGNVNGVFQFRAQSTEDAEAFGDRAGRRLLRIPCEGETYEPAFFDSGFRGVDDFRAAFSKQVRRQELAVVPASAVLDLPTFHYFARWEGRVYRGFVPWIEQKIHR